MRQSRGRSSPSVFALARWMRPPRSARRQWPNKTFELSAWQVLPHLNWRRSRRRSHGTTDGAGDRANLLHHARELIRVQRLTAVGQGALRVWMDFDDDAVSAGSNRRATHRRHLVAKPRAMAGIGDHRQ